MIKLFHKLNKPTNRFVLMSLAILLMLSGCSASSYLVVSDADTPVYSTENDDSLVTTIPAKNAFVYRRGSKRQKIKYGQFNGYSGYLTSWKKLKKLNRRQVQNLEFTEGRGYAYNGVSNSLTSGGSVAGKSSTPSAGGGAVQVKGYTRKNGTYVRPHTRSSPRRH
ncbi:hypothetical protein DBR43_30130 [Pedobacter sp. KBW06]|uniref:hypothetical protein n=1 Tax=Pedobacter sp. KBW06 TaxID=2153359 RepID=UPI000F5A932F|nr:hypothetical protein [Pedobacter sp. KBW06]RQO66468.1 hypothetical protein DBR43_30130 [Pedobacter sp. KBW06]